MNLECNALLAVALLVSPPAFAEVCTQMQNQLDLPEQVQVSRTWGRFKDHYDEKEYEGCMLHASGNSRSVPDFYARLMALYPNNDNELGKAGWKADRQSDGPDGTSFTVVNGERFCQVTGNWGNEKFAFQVECSKIK